MRHELESVWKAKPKLVRLIENKCRLIGFDPTELELDRQTEEGLQAIYESLYEHTKGVAVEKIDDELLNLFALSGYIDATNGSDIINGDNAVTELSRFYKVYKDVIPNRGYRWADYGSKYILSFTYHQETATLTRIPKVNAPLGVRLTQTQLAVYEATRQALIAQGLDPDNLPAIETKRKLQIANERTTPKGSALPSEVKYGFNSVSKFDQYSGRFEDCEIILGNFLPTQPREDYHHFSTASLLASKQVGAYYILDHKHKRKIRIPDKFQASQQLRECFLKRFSNASIVYLRNDQTTEGNITRLERKEATNAQLGYTQAVKKAKSKMSSGGNNPNSFSSYSESLASHRTDHMVDLRSRSYTLDKVEEKNGRKLPRLKFNLNLSSCGSFIYYNSPVETKLAAKIISDTEGYITVVPVALKVTPGSQDERVWECVLKYLGFDPKEQKQADKHDELGNRIQPRGDSEKLQELKTMLTPHESFKGIHQAKIERKQAKQKQRKLTGCSIPLEVNYASHRFQQSNKSPLWNASWS